MKSTQRLVAGRADRTSASHFRTEQRRNPTDAEHLFWQAVRNRKLGGYKFARQVTIGNYTADFVCRRLKLIVELDGPEHNKARDSRRTRWLNERGYGMVRFDNDDVIVHRPQVLQRLLQMLEGNLENVSSEVDYSPALPPERVRS